MIPNSDELHAALQIERELETEDLVLLSQVRKALKVESAMALAARGSLPYVAKPSLGNPGATIATGR
jgi:hypothetical protein